MLTIAVQIWDKISTWKCGEESALLTQHFKLSIWTELTDFSYFCVSSHQLTRPNLVIAVKTQINEMQSDTKDAVTYYQCGPNTSTNVSACHPRSWVQDTHVLIDLIAITDNSCSYQFFFKLRLCLKCANQFNSHHV